MAICKARYFPRTSRHVREFQRILNSAASSIEDAIECQIVNYENTPICCKLTLTKASIKLYAEVTSFGLVCVRTNSKSASEVAESVMEGLWAIYMKKAKSSAAQINAGVLDFSSANANSFGRTKRVEVFLDAVLQFLDQIGIMNRKLYANLQNADLSKDSGDQSLLSDHNFLNLPTLENRVKQTQINLREAKSFFHSEIQKSNIERTRFEVTVNQAEFMTYLVRISYDTFKNKYDMHLLQRQWKVARLALWFGIIASLVAVVSLLVSLEIETTMLELSGKSYPLTPRTEIAPAIDGTIRNSIHPSLR